MARLSRHCCFQESVVDCFHTREHEEAVIKGRAMAEMGEALRSCMERLVIAREERQQIIVEAANENYSNVELFL